MKKYEYENATVYITIPTEKQLANIRKATEKYLSKILSKGIDIHGWRDNDDRSIGKNNNGAKQRTGKTARNNRQTKSKDKTI